MTTGDSVRVHPHGNPELTATGTVLMVSESQRSIAVTFEDKPPFMGREGYMILPGYGIVMLALREELNGKPWGPWIEIISDGHFEIEELA